MPLRENLEVNNKDNRVLLSRNYRSVLKTTIFALEASLLGQIIVLRTRGNEFLGRNTLLILPSLHNRTHSKVEEWGRWSARPKICLIVKMNLQQSG